MMAIILQEEMVRNGEGKKGGKCVSAFPRRLLLHEAPVGIMIAKANPGAGIKKLAGPVGRFPVPDQVHITGRCAHKFQFRNHASSARKRDVSRDTVGTR